MGEQKHFNFLISQIELCNCSWMAYSPVTVEYQRLIVLCLNGSVWLMPRSPRVPGSALSLVFLNAAGVLADPLMVSLFEDSSLNPLLQHTHTGGKGLFSKSLKGKKSEKKACVRSKASRLKISFKANLPPTVMAAEVFVN